jgi:hypothetical protein
MAGISDSIQESWQRYQTASKRAGRDIRQHPREILCFSLWRDMRQHPRELAGISDSIQESWQRYQTASDGATAFFFMAGISDSIQYQTAFKRAGRDIRQHPRELLHFSLWQGYQTASKGAGRDIRQHPRELLLFFLWQGYQTASKGATAFFMARISNSIQESYCVFIYGRDIYGSAKQINIRTGQKLMFLFQYLLLFIFSWTFQPVRSNSKLQTNGNETSACKWAYTGHIQR